MELPLLIRTNHQLSETIRSGRLRHRLSGDMKLSVFYALYVHLSIGSGRKNSVNTINRYPDCGGKRVQIRRKGTFFIP